MENIASKSDKRLSQNTRRHSAHKSSHVLRQRKIKNKTASPDCSSLSEKTNRTPNVTVLTPPPAISLHHTASLHEPCNKTDPAVFADQRAAAVTCEQTPLVPSIVVNSPSDEKTGNTLRCHGASGSSNAVDWQCDNDREASCVADVAKAACSAATVPAHRHGADEFADGVIDHDPKTHADRCMDACDVGDTDVDISDSSLHLDTQMLRAIAGPSVDDVKVTNILEPATVVPMATTNDDRLMSENLLDTSSELDGVGPTSVTCQFMKEFSTPKCMATATAAVAEKIGDREVGHGSVVAVETVHNPFPPQPDLSVNVTSELLAASNFDRICATGVSEMNRQAAYSEEMFDDVDQFVQVQNLLTDKPKYNLSTCPSNQITSDPAEKYVAEVCVADKSDLFASYIEELDTAVRADVCSADLPAENSFGLAHDSLTNTMLDQAMAAVNRPAVDDQSDAVKHPSISAADANPLSDVDANFGAGNELRDPQPHTDVLPLHNTESPDVDAEAALHLLCASSYKSAKKAPKRRGRKRNSDSADPFNKPGTCSVEDKRRRTLSHSPQLLAESERADVSLNDAVCGRASCSVSFGSTSDSSAFIPPTPPSTAAEKSNVQTPRRLLGGVAGVTPVKSDSSIHKVKKGDSQFKSHENKERSQHKTTGGTEVTVNKCDEKIDGISPLPSQGLNATQSFTIIDVAANRLLFDTFIAEWKQRQSFSLSVACEKRPKPQAQHSRLSTEGIGAKFKRGNPTFELFFFSIS